MTVNVKKKKKRNNLEQLEEEEFFIKGQEVFSTILIHFAYWLQ